MQQQNPPDEAPADHAGHAARAAYARRLERVVSYVEANLDGDLSLEVLARVAHLSRYHFHRQFRAFTGMGIARLVRLLRLRRAAIRLAFNPTHSITDIALASGFENPESFGRAFRRMHGQSPSSFRRSPRWSSAGLVPVVATLQETRMNTEVDIVDFPATRVAAVTYQGPPEQELTGVMQLVAWRRANGVPPEHGMTIGIHYGDPASTPPAEYRMDVCVSYEGEIGPNPYGVEEKQIPAGRCARVRHLGSREYIGEADWIYRDWLPGSGETLRDFPPFFHYVNVGPDVREEDMITDVYLPLI